VAGPGELEIDQVRPTVRQQHIVGAAVAMSEAEPGTRLGHPPGHGADLFRPWRATNQRYDLVDHGAAPGLAADRRRDGRGREVAAQDVGVTIDAADRRRMFRPDR